MRIRLATWIIGLTTVLVQAGFLDTVFLDIVFLDTVIVSAPGRTALAQDRAGQRQPGKRQPKADEEDQGKLAPGKFGTGFGQAETDPKGAQLDQALVQEFEVGIVVTAASGPCADIVGTTPIPIAWPEQQVEVIKEDFSPFVGNVAYRMIGGTVKQMVITIPQLPAGEEARAVVTLRITRHSLLPPDQTSIYVSPERKKVPKDLRLYLAASPYIESQNGKIKTLAKQIVQDKETAWERVEAIYDWVRDNVEYKEGPIKGAMQALKDKNGDCEELTSLFVALCRANGIPARCVWVPQHCYPEFYLEDDDGKGHWFPCQAAGARAFGGIPEHRPILQKGDNFKTPENPRKAQRYVAEFLTGTPLPGGGQPKVKFIRQAVNGQPAAAAR